MITVLTDRGETHLAGAEAAGDALWLPPREAEAATGWTLEAEGPCRDGACVPLPPGRAEEIVRGGRLNVAGLWRHLGKPVARSARGDVWVLGESARERGAGLRSLEAPDFALPDPSGRVHRLSEHRGKKVLLVTWASW
jgi:hypothetical protein